MTSRVEQRNGYIVRTLGQASAWTHVHRCAAGHEFDVTVLHKGDATPDARCPACGETGERLDECQAFASGERRQGLASPDFAAVTARDYETWKRAQPDRLREFAATKAGTVVGHWMPPECLRRDLERVQAARRKR